MATDGDTDSGLEGIDVEIVKGLIIVGCVAALLFALIIVRLGCNVFIDLIVLRDSGSVTRALSEARRTVLPWWHPRTQPQGSMTNGFSVQDSRLELGNRNVVEEELGGLDMDRVLAGLTAKAKQDLLASVLPAEVSNKNGIVMEVSGSTLEL